MCWLIGSETCSFRESTFYQQALQTKELLALLAGFCGSIGSATWYVHTALEPRDWELCSACWAQAAPHFVSSLEGLRPEPCAVANSGYVGEST